jgi:hypothetical protein
VFDGSGNYNVNINVHDLGRHACAAMAPSQELFVVLVPAHNANAILVKLLWVLFNWQMNGNAGTS